MKALKLLRGWWRHIWGFCPACNCDAPECDTCPICEDYSGRVRPAFPFPKEERSKWWERFKLSLPLLAILLSSCTGYYHEAHSITGNYERDVLLKVGGTASQKGADGSSIVTDDQQSLRDAAAVAGTAYGTHEAQVGSTAANASNNRLEGYKAQLDASSKKTPTVLTTTTKEGATFQTVVPSDKTPPLPKF